MREFEKFINNLNDSLMPISKEIEVKLKFLQKFAEMEGEYNFKPISKDDLKP